MKMKLSKMLEMLNVALGVKTTYALGGFGFPLNETNKIRLLNNRNNEPFRSAINAGNMNVFAFDCVCLFKAILWGWVANTKLNYGGAVYKSNGVADVNADVMMTSKYVTGLSTDFSKIEIGHFVGMKGHIGMYVGNGEVIECTPIWGAKVMKTKLSARNWINHGKSIYIDYSENVVENDVKIGIGSLVKIKSGSKYQGASLGKPVSTYALNGEWKIKDINNLKNIALLDSINSWLRVEDLQLVNGEIGVGDIVKIRSGSKYQGASLGKPVSTYALNGKWKIKDINKVKGVALLDDINSWLKLEDLSK